MVKHQFGTMNTPMAIQNYLWKNISTVYWKFSGCQSGEIDQIADIASRASQVISSGGSVYCSTNVGHMPAPEQTSKRRGHPGEDIIHDHQSILPKSTQWTETRMK